MRVINDFGVKNQYVISDGEHLYFQSYKSLCAMYDTYKKVLWLYQDFDYSTTTSKYLHMFLNIYVNNNIYDFIKKHDIRKEKKLEYQNIKIEFILKIF